MADGVSFVVNVRVERTRPCHGVVTVAVAGEVDLATVPELRSTLSQVIASPGQEVVVDLAGVEFMDASGVGALVGAAAEAARRGVQFRLAAPSPQAARVLELARLDGSLAVDL